MEDMINDLLIQAEAEILSLSEDEREQLLGGYENRGLDCISERWYAPDRMRVTSALYKLGRMIIDVDRLLEKYNNLLANEDC